MDTLSFNQLLINILAVLGLLSITVLLLKSLNLHREVSRHVYKIWPFSTFTNGHQCLKIALGFYPGLFGETDDDNALVMLQDCLKNLRDTYRRLLDDAIDEWELIITVQKLSSVFVQPRLEKPRAETLPTQPRQDSIMELLKRPTVVLLDLDNTIRGSSPLNADVVQNSLKECCKGQFEFKNTAAKFEKLVK